MGGHQIRVLVSRSEKDLQRIKDAYMDLYHKHLAAAVKSETCASRRSATYRVLF